MKRLLLNAMLLISTCAVQAQGSNPVAEVNAAQEGAPISPCLYGQFVEHAGNLIYTTLWSEMLDDRKFYYAVMPKPPEETNAAPRGGGFAGRRRGVGPGRWNPIGPVDSVVMDTHNPFVGDHTPLIKLAGSEPRGIRQTGLNFVEGATYNGRIQLAGDPAAKIFVRVVWGTNIDSGGGGMAMPITSRLDKHYRKFSFSFSRRISPARRDLKLSAPAPARSTSARFR